MIKSVLIKSDFIKSVWIQDTNNKMTALKLVNNTSLRSEKNLCYVNTELQLLYSIPDVNQFFTSKKYRESYEQRLPVCDEISRIFGTGGQIQASAAELRRLVGVFHGRSDICNGIQQDIEEFHTCCSGVLKLSWKESDISS